ncbi:MAG: TIM barrel protein [bacterium]
MKKLFFGTAGIPVITKTRTYPEALKDIIKLNLGCLEMEFVHGVKMNKPVQDEVKRLSGSLGVILSAHGPYYINLNAREQEKIDASVKRILDTARVAYNCEAYSITFHAAYYLGKNKEETYKQVKTKLTEIIETLKQENIKIWVRPEITGKATQWGDLEELIKISKEVEMVLPCIDFSHLHARSAGLYNTYDEFAKILEKIGSEIGDYALQNFHAHIAGIEYGLKGEKRHLLLRDSDFNYKDLIKALKDFDVKGIIICESPNLEGDALILQNEYLNLIGSG